jgi:NAD(P)-dependent dehydrogenase (short-subunit alcohol dehydrogenase family)
MLRSHDFENRREAKCQKKLEGKIALITGGTTGIGLATAKRFVAEGATVFITGRRKDKLDEAIKEIGPNAIGIQADSANLADLDGLYAEIKKQEERLDVLFANAGIGEFASLEQITEDHFDRIVGINLKGVVFTVQNALSLIPKGGAIILNASIVSIKGMPAFGIYSAVKAAVRSLARTWTNELKDRTDSGERGEPRAYRYTRCGWTGQRRRRGKTTKGRTHFAGPAGAYGAAR